MTERDLHGSQSVDRALKLLSLVGRSAERGLSLNKLVEDGGFNKTTTRRLLLALMRARLVDQDEVDRQYYLGQEAYVLGMFASHRFGLLDVSMQSLIRIARESGDAAFVSVRRHTHAICLHREDGNFPIRSHFLQKGSEYPLGIGAGSLAMLAFLEDWEVEQILGDNAVEIESGFPGVTLADLRSRVAATRAKGYSVNPGLVYESAWGIGVAVAYPDGRLAGALSIAAIDSRLQEPRQSKLAALLREEVASIQTKLARMVEPKKLSSPSRLRDGGDTRLQVKRKRP